jgi:hypothetical protein
MTHAEFSRLSRESTTKFHRRWSVGPQVRSEGRLFYEQGGATCQFLYHAEKGRFRKTLLDFIAARYTGKADKLDIAAAMGLPAAELGARVEAFAKQVAQGWRPE